VDGIGIIGLVVGLWVALSPTGEQGSQRPPPAWLGWLLAGTCTVLLLTDTLTDPLTPHLAGTLTTDWTSDATPGQTVKSSSFSSGDGQIATIAPTGSDCSLTSG
jgi:hypothetical protein